MRKAKLHLNLSYVTKLVLRGKWEKVEKHLSGFFPLAFTEQDHATNELLSLIKRQRFLHLLYMYVRTFCARLHPTALTPALHSSLSLSLSLWDTAATRKHVSKCCERTSRW